MKKSAEKFAIELGKAISNNLNREQLAQDFLKKFMTVVEWNRSLLLRRLGLITTGEFHWIQVSVEGRGSVQRYLPQRSRMSRVS